jgi:hypothetical protein
MYIKIHLAVVYKFIVPLQHLFFGMYKKKVTWAGSGEYREWDKNYAVSGLKFLQATSEIIDISHLHP